MEKREVPEWFYYISIAVAFLFTIYISIYAAIHFESIKYMNLVVVFLFLTMAMFFVITAVYFKTEKMGYHTLAPILFFAGIVGLIFYAFKAVDASNIVRFSIIYAIVVSGISLFILMQKKKAESAGNPIESQIVATQSVFPEIAVSAPKTIFLSASPKTSKKGRRKTRK